MENRRGIEIISVVTQLHMFHDTQKKWTNQESRGNVNTDKMEVMFIIPSDSPYWREGGTTIFYMTTNKSMQFPIEVDF